MGRKVTQLNPSHPHTALKRTLQNAKAKFRTMNNGDLLYEWRLHHGNDDVAPTRTQMIKDMIQVTEQLFKKKWKENYGWEFDECYDPRKLKEHLKKMREAKNEEQEQGEQDGT